MLAAQVKHLPPLAGSQSPSALERLRHAPDPELPHPHTPAGTAELFRKAYGPTVRAFEVLDEDGRASLAASLTALWVEGQRPGARQPLVESEYLEVVAVRK